MLSQCPIRDPQINKSSSSSSFIIFANLQGTGITDEVEEQQARMSRRVDPNLKLRRNIPLEPPSLISRRSATTSMASTAASILFSVTTALPALAVADEDEATFVGGDNIKTTTTTDDLLDASAVDDPPPVAAKQKMIEYTVQDFTVALPANWKVITRYDEKAAKKPPSTPTLFSAIDFNSGAVISIVKEEGCSINEYAKSSFETSKNANKNNAPANKRCNFVLKNANNDEGIFSAETYEKDASKLLIRHDDRDNAVFRGMSTIEESNLNGEPSSSSASSETTASTSTSTSTDSYSSSLLELRATTTIPTSGTYRDTMGLEQLNTIDRKVLAKAVATTMIVTTRKADASAEVVLPPATESTLLAKSETKATTAKKEAIDKSSALVPSRTTTTSSTTTAKAEATTATASVSGKEAIRTSSDVGVSTTENPPSTFTAEVTTVTPKDLSEKYSDAHSSKTLTTAEPATVTTAVTPTPTSADSTFQESTPISSTAKNSPMVAMMAMSAMIIEEPTLANSDEGPSVDTVLKALRAEAIESAVKIVKETPMETAIEAVKETSIEPVIEKVKETAKETAKEMALEMLNGTTEPQKASADATAASAIVPPPGQVPQLATSTTQTTSTPHSGATYSEGASANPIAADTIAPLEPHRTTALASNVDARDVNASPSDAKLVASASPTGTPANTNASANANEPLAATTITTTVLSIWLSTPSDEWQKPVMGTRLKQIWESVKYTSNVVESSDNNLAILDSDEESLNAQLLLMNKGAFR
jgi:hypothetical protein